MTGSESSQGSSSNEYGQKNKHKLHTVCKGCEAELGTRPDRPHCLLAELGSPDPTAFILAELGSPDLTARPVWLSWDLLT